MLTLNYRGTISILVAHHNVMSSELIYSAFERRTGFNVVGRALTTSDLVESLESLEPDVCLISTRLQDGPAAGFAALRHLRGTRPSVRSVMLLDAPDPQFIVDSFRGGARGVFCPSLNPFRMLCRCVSRVHAGEFWASASELSYVMDAFANDAPLRLPNIDGRGTLARREQAVVRLVAAGLTNREIAHELTLSEHTVKNYLFRIFDKLGVSSRMELVCQTARPFQTRGSIETINPAKELKRINHQHGAESLQFIRRSIPGRTAI